MATETGKTEAKFFSRWTRQFEEKRFFRFNVEQGLQQVGLAEYKEQGVIEAATFEYLRHPQQKLRVGDCVMNLKQKQGVYCISKILHCSLGQLISVDHPDTSFALVVKVSV